MLTRRHTLMTMTAAAGAMILPFQLRADGHGGDVFETEAGPVTVHPIAHASVVMETPWGTIYIDPVGDVALYDGLPDADLILITHEHGDHYNAETLAALRSGGPQVITNPAVFGMLDDTDNTTALANGEEGTWGDIRIQAIPAYNVTEERLNFHPEGRDNGYVIHMDGFVTYVSGDTEDTTEMRALEGIDLAFVCMNLPFTMDAEAAADAVRSFQPSVVYPYHYRGRDDGTQDPEAFAQMVGDAAEVRFGNWYG